MKSVKSWNVVRRTIATAAILLALPALGYTQEATLSGVVSDTTGGVLPGVTVTAIHQASGNVFEAVSDGRGEFRVPVRTGDYRITVQLSGFSTINRTLELLVGQQAVVNFQLSPSTVQESVTVTGEAPLVDVTTSSLSANIDPRQMKQLPINGRNWMDLALLAAGNRANATGTNDEVQPRTAGTYQINLDGQQVTNTLATGGQGQPHFSQDAIAEFEFVSSRFDASQGRSSGVQINAISKSGTNTFAGSLSGFFRNDRFIAKDFVAGRVLPYSNTQVSTTFGGPIRRDRLHFFGNFEYEREPQTFTYTSVYPLFNVDQYGIRRLNTGGGRVDGQFSPHMRLSVRASRMVHDQPFEGASRVTGGATSHPSGTNSALRSTNDIQATLTNVFGNRTVNEVRVGLATYYWLKNPNVKWPDSPTGRGTGAPQINFIGYRIGQGTVNIPNEVRQDNYSFRDDLSYSFAAGGRHDIKLGGEYIYNLAQGVWYCPNQVGTYDAQGGPIPANIESLFPVWNDVSTWNLAAISPIVRKYTSSSGDCHPVMPRHVYASWFQDDWKISQKLTLNLGVRYDLYIGAFAEWTAIAPFFGSGRSNDMNNVGPRIGASYALTERTVVRGGFGKYFAEVQDTSALWPVIWSQQAAVEVLNDSRATFAANPFNGARPTYQQVLARACDVAVTPTCLRRALTSLPSPDSQVPYSYQSSVGMQRQLSGTMGVNADYVYVAGRADLISQNVNLGFNPATGLNYPFTNFALRPFPEWGSVQMNFPVGRSAYHGLQTAFTKRMSNRWQASATYSLSGFWDGDPPPMGLVRDQATGIATSSRPLSFAVPSDLGGEWGLATTDQRHRAVVNAIWELGYGVQVSGVYFYGSGLRYATTYGGDPRATGGGSSRLRPDGTIVPRNNFVGNPIHRADMRVQKRLNLVGRAGLDVLVEMFNVFNHANYSAFVTQESLRSYGQPSSDPTLANTPRMLQLGFRFLF